MQYQRIYWHIEQKCVKLTPQGEQICKKLCFIKTELFALYIHDFGLAGVHLGGEGGFENDVVHVAESTPERLSAFTAGIPKRWWSDSELT